MTRSVVYIMLTCPGDEDPFTPHFDIVKLALTGVDIIFLFSLQNIDCGYSLDLPQSEAVLMCTNNLCFEQKEEKYLFFLSTNYYFYSP